MYEITIIYFCIIILILCKIGLSIKFKKLKNLKIRTNDELRKIAEKYPDDETICRTILKKLNNEDVKIVINEEYESCLYTIYNNTITIGKFKENYMKIQTIAHECIHSCQNKSKLWFNFIISNIQSLYFFITLILILFNKLPITYIFLGIFIMLSFLHYIIRSNLETDAMTRAPYLAEKYIIENNIMTMEEKDELLKEYEEVNDIGIDFTNYSIIIKNIIKIIIYCVAILV